MKYIDLDKWERKTQFEFFKKMDYPHFNICANVEITEWIEYVKENNIPFFISMVYATSKVANNIREFRLRLRDNVVVEHEFLNPATTIMADSGVFNFCKIEYNEDFSVFELNAKQNIEKCKKNVELKDEAGEDDVLLMTSLPWVSFTSVSHPINLSPVDSMPRITWGKYFKQDNKIMMPLSIQVHHAMMDGEHASRFFKLFEELVSKPQEHLW